MNATNLRIPGPTPVPPRVMRAMQREMVPHRGPAVAALFKDLLRQLRLIHGTSGDAFVFAGTGSAGWEIALVNTLSPGDKVVAVINGHFGARWAGVAETFGLQVIRVEVEWGEAAGPEVVGPALAAHSDARALLYVHNETSTGVVNPLAEVGQVVREHGSLLLVDSVSGAAAMPVEMDRTGADLVVSGSQKAWMCPPGLAIVAVGPRVWQARERAQYPRFFWDLGAAKEAAEQGSTRSTAPLTMVFALKAACDMIEAEGLANVFERHRSLAALARDGLRALGFRPLAEAARASPSVTAARPPAGFEAPDIIAAMRERHGITIGSGQARLRDRIIRIGHMGWVHEPELRRTLAALAEVVGARRP